ncbi:DUF1062 domain-containing protein [Kineococcus sp. NBC_00420]|uniref:DUF1062 domain-containing protein n=1 Tax=Kineococcus sp. NBC_00420 TaxID=2903564 RepID=UPI002E1DC3B8
MPTTWAVTPTCLPLIVRRCPRCGHDRFAPSGRFRVNASGKLLDAWLLALCTTCGETLKVPVLERVHVRRVPADLLNRLHRNDVDLVADLLHGAPALRHVVLDWTGAWRLDTGGASVPSDPNAVLEVLVRVEARIPVRPVRLLAAGLGLSRAQVERWVESGTIVASVDLRGRVSGDFAFLLKR